MLANRPETVIQISELLPPEGESNVSYQLNGMVLQVEIEYENDKSRIETIAIVFRGVVMMHVASVPGVNSLSIQCSGTHKIGDVVEF